MSETAAASAGPFPVPGLTPPTQRTGAKRRIGDVIVTLGFAEREKVEAVVSQGQGGVPLGQLLIDAGIVNSNQLAHALAERNGLDFVDLNVFEVDKGAANLIDAAKARRYRTIPIAFLGEGTLLVATADPANVLALDDITMATGYEVRRAVASPEDIDALIGQISRLGDAVEEIDHDELDGAAEVIELRDQAEEAPVVKLVHSIIADGVQRGASDIHFEPRGGEMRVRFRVDGVVSDTTTVPRALTPGLVSRVKIMADLDIAEKRLPQDGRIGLTVDGHYVDLRVATLPVVRGESVVMRILDKQKAPVEYELEGVKQVQVNPRSGLTFASGLRSMVRADPDIIMVGEVRDRETAQLAIEAALTGHLVLTTLHTNSAPLAVARLIEMGIEPYLVSAGVKCVVAQRLGRRLCECRGAVGLGREALGASHFDADSGILAHEPAGCVRCSGTGYRGRVGIYELMQLSDDVRRLVLDKASADELRACARQEGMLTLREDGFEKVKRGVTSVGEVLRVLGSGER